ncbi:MAG: hypothetical protein EBS07_12750, partial [Sphingobacteriia bacterium]|nr:hypothetical protein [Sphingobacteriia bacterium]
MIFENNRLTDISGFGVWMQYMDAAIIRNNFIDLTANATTSIQYGIYTQFMYNSTRILSNDVRTKNYGAFFSNTLGASGQRALVANNFFNATHPTGTTLYGLYEVSGTFVDYFHNTVTTTNPNTSFSYTLWDQGGSFKTFHNNIFRNNGLASANNHVVYISLGTGTVYDYNDYWWPTGTTNIGFHSTWGTNMPTSQWTTFRSSTYGGANSLNIDPLFLSSTNLRHYNNALNAGFNQISRVPTDIDGFTRTTPVTIGADEFKPVANDAAVVSIVSNPPCIGVSNFQVRIGNYGTTTLTSATINWTVNGVNQPPFSWTGSLVQNAVSTPITVGTFNFLFGTNYTITSATSLPNGVTDGNTLNDQTSINTAPALGGTYTIGSGGNYASFSAAV